MLFNHASNTKAQPHICKSYVRFCHINWNKTSARPSSNYSLWGDTERWNAVTACGALTHLQNRGISAGWALQTWVLEVLLADHFCPCMLSSAKGNESDGELKNTVQVYGKSLNVGGKKDTTTVSWFHKVGRQKTWGKVFYEDFWGRKCNLKQKWPTPQAHFSAGLRESKNKFVTKINHWVYKHKKELLHKHAFICHSHWTTCRESEHSHSAQNSPFKLDIQLLIGW